jgi:hypothetical protein
VAIKPFQWISWREARHQMPEIWDEWRYQTARADNAMVNSLRRGKVPCRLDPDNLRAGAYEDRGSVVWWSGEKVDLRNIVAGLLRLDFGSPMRGEFDTTEWGSVLALGGYQNQPIALKKTAVLVGAELTWEQFHDDLICFELPAGARARQNRRGGKTPGPKAGAPSIKDRTCQIALKILADEHRRPPRGYRRLMTIARLVNAEIEESYKDDSIRKMIGPTVREWEGKHPNK